MHLTPANIVFIATVAIAILTGCRQDIDSVSVDGVSLGSTTLTDSVSVDGVRLGSTIQSAISILGCPESRTIDIDRVTLQFRLANDIASTVVASRDTVVEVWGTKLICNQQQLSRNDPISKVESILGKPEEIREEWDSGESAPWLKYHYRINGSQSLVVCTLNGRAISFRLSRE